MDELEKAHPQIPSAFLGMLQSGKIEMNSGKDSQSREKQAIAHSRVTDLGNTLWIFTSNVGEHSIAQEKTRAV